MSSLGKSTLCENRAYAHLDGHQGIPDRPQPFYPFTRAEDNDLFVATQCGLTVAEVALDLGRPQHHVHLRLGQIARLLRVHRAVVGGSAVSSPQATGPDAVPVAGSPFPVPAVAEVAS